MSFIFQSLYFGVGAYVATMSYIILDKIEGKSSNLRRSVEGLAAIGIFLVSMALTFFILSAQCVVSCKNAAISRVPMNSIIILVVGIPLITLAGILMKEAESIDDEILKTSAKTMMAVIASFTGIGGLFGIYSLFTRSRKTKQEKQRKEGFEEVVSKTE